MNTDFADTFTARFPEAAFYISYESFDREEEGFHHRIPKRQRQGRPHLTVASVLSFIGECILSYWLEGEAEIAAKILEVEANNYAALAVILAGLANEVQEGGYYLVETQEQDFCRRSAADLKALEPVALDIARRHGVTVGTVEFVTAVKIELSREEEVESSRREAMREDGPCVGYGVNQSQWQEEFDSPTYAVCKARKLMEWLREFHPLLMMTWESKFPGGLIPRSKSGGRESRMYLLVNGTEACMADEALDGRIVAASRERGISLCCQYDSEEDAKPAQALYREFLPDAVLELREGFCPRAE